MRFVQSILLRTLFCYRFWNENQTVVAGETVMTVVPENEGEMIGSRTQLQDFSSVIIFLN